MLIDVQRLVESTTPYKRSVKLEPIKYRVNRVKLPDLQLLSTIRLFVVVMAFQYSFLRGEGVVLHSNIIF